MLNLGSWRNGSSKQEGNEVTLAAGGERYLYSLGRTCAKVAGKAVLLLLATLSAAGSSVYRGLNNAR